MRDVWIRGAAMTRFGDHAGRTARELVEEAVSAALGDAELDWRDIQAAYVGNAAAGLTSGQECIRGQVVLRRTGLLGVPIFNLENSCASSATALHLAWQAIAGGLHDCVIVVGHEKLERQDRGSVRRILQGTLDLDEIRELFRLEPGQDRDVFADSMGAAFPDDPRSPFSSETLALVAVKNHRHGSLNPCAHRQRPVTVEEVLAAPKLGGRLTRLMSAPWCDGAACLVLCDGDLSRGRRGGVRITASVLVSGRGDDLRRRFSVGVAARRAYEQASIAAEDLDVVELYDATAGSELQLYVELGLCREGEADRLLHDGETWLGGRLPVNPSGGLLARGHPIGATGAAQVVELAWQLEGRCGERQVPEARVGMAEITGGWLGTDVAACCVHILQV